MTIKVSQHRKHHRKINKSKKNRRHKYKIKKGGSMYDPTLQPYMMGIASSYSNAMNAPTIPGSVLRMVKISATHLDNIVVQKEKNPMYNLLREYEKEMVTDEGIKKAYEFLTTEPRFLIDRIFTPNDKKPLKKLLEHLAPLHDQTVIGGEISNMMSQMLSQMGRKGGKPTKSVKIKKTKKRQHIKKRKKTQKGGLFGDDCVTYFEGVLRGNPYHGLLGMMCGAPFYKLIAKFILDEIPDDQIPNGVGILISIGTRIMARNGNRVINRFLRRVQDDRDYTMRLLNELYDINCGNLEEEQPETDEQQTNEEEEQPETDEQQPNEEEKQPETDEQQPNEEEKQPETDEQPTEEKEHSSSQEGGKEERIYPSIQCQKPIEQINLSVYFSAQLRDAFNSSLFGKCVLSPTKANIIEMQKNKEEGVPFFGDCFFSLTPIMRRFMLTIAKHGYIGQKMPSTGAQTMAINQGMLQQMGLNNVYSQQTLKNTLQETPKNTHSEEEDDFGSPGDSEDNFDFNKFMKGGNRKKTQKRNIIMVRKINKKI